MSSKAALRRAVLSLSLLVVLVAGLVPAAAATEVTDATAQAPSEEAAAAEAVAEDATPSEPAEEADEPGEPDEPAEPTEEPADEPAEAPAEDPTDAPTDPIEGAEDVDRDRPEDADADAEGDGDVTDAVDVRASDRADADAADDGDAEAEAVPAPADIQVVELDADAYCDLITELGEEIDLGELTGEPDLSATPGTVLPDVDSAEYRGLLEAVDAVLAQYDDAFLVSATYDGTTLAVTVVPDLSDCEALDGVPLPEPADDLDDVEVIVTVITQEDVCEALEEVEGAPPADGDAEPIDIDLEELFDLRTGEDLSPEELEDVTGLGAELDAVLADNPDSGVVSVSYDGATLAVVVGPDADAALECEEPVVAEPIADRDDDDDSDVDDADDDDDVLAATGFDTPRQAGAGLAAVLLGAALVGLGRRRYRGAHLVG